MRRALVLRELAESDEPVCVAMAIGVRLLTSAIKTIGSLLT